MWRTVSLRSSLRSSYVYTARVDLKRSARGEKYIVALLHLAAMLSQPV